MEKYKTYKTEIEGAYYYDCPEGITINGVTRETLTFDGDDINSVHLDVYPTNKENMAFVTVEEPMAVMYALTTYIEKKLMSINELKTYINETFDEDIEDIESYNF